MLLELDDIRVRDFRRSDAIAIHSIVREKGVLRFMGDWAANCPSPENFYGFFNWCQTQKDSTDVQENKRYAVALADTDRPIGMVGMGMEDTINEVEMAYFMAEAYQRRGYTKRAVLALADWCFRVSDLPYLVLTIDVANEPSCRFAENCGFTLFERRTPIGHRQPNMESDSY